MSRLDHPEFDLAAFKDSRRKSVASHLFDGRPIYEKVLLRLYLRWEVGLQNAALPRVPISNLKRYRLGPLVDLLFGGLGKLAHTCSFGEIGRGLVGGPADSIDAGRPSRDLFGLWQALWTVVRAGLRVADGLGQHLA